MKKTFFVALTLALSCCTLGDVPTSPTPSEPSIDSHPIFHATIDSEDDSRVYFDDKIRIRWTADDRISLFEGTTRNKQYKFLGETGDNAGDFDYVKAGFGTGNDVDRYYAIYPYVSTNKLHEDGYITYTFPTTQHYAVGSIGLDANVMVAVTADLDDYDLRFRNACSYLRVMLYGDNQTVGSITLTAIGGEVLTGKAYITPSYGDTPTTQMIESGNTVTLSCGDGVSIGATREDATAFWIVVPPFTASQGISVTINGYYGGSQTYNITSEVPFARNLYNTLTRELNIHSSGTGLGISDWSEGSKVEGEI